MPSRLVRGRKGEENGAHFAVAALGTTVMAALAGIGLGLFAAGGLEAQLAADDGRAPLGNPAALVADSYAGDGYPAAPAPTAQVPCVGCGPGLAERRAIERSAAYDRMLERQAARFDAMLDESVPYEAEADAAEDMMEMPAAAILPL